MSDQLRDAFIVLRALREEPTTPKQIEDEHAEPPRRHRPSRYEREE